MAKIKTQQDSEAPEVQGKEIQKAEVLETGEHETKNESVELTEKITEKFKSPQGAKKEESQVKKEPEFNQQVSDILKSHATYESLYIDKQGGVFTEDTLAIIRKSANLYKNPYYKP